MNQSLRVAAILLMCIVVSGNVLAEDNQTIGTDFAVTKENVPQKEPVYSRLWALRCLSIAPIR